MSKCICHIFGYEIKDAKARRLLEDLVKRVEALEKGGTVTPEEPTPPEEGQYTVSYYKTMEYNNNGESAFTDRELIETQTYAEGETITPPTVPTEEGYTASEWENI